MRLDLNFSPFQEDLFRLEVSELQALIRTLDKIRKLTWDELYQARGLKWELLHSRYGPEGERLYSFRVGKKFRALAFRDGDFLVVVSLHPDHDSAYG